MQSDPKPSHLAALCELVSGTLRLALPFELPETADSVYQHIDLRPGQFLAKCRHAGLAAGDRYLFAGREQTAKTHKLLRKKRPARSNV
jgi:hypothetical protein